MQTSGFMSRFYPALFGTFPEIKKWATLSVILLLNACTTAPPPATEWDKHQHAVSAIHDYNAKGKVAFISPEQRISASFYWQQRGDNTRLQLTNFLGSTLLKLEMSPTGAKVTDNDGNDYYGTDATRLFYRLTGVELPVTALPFWIKGLPTSKDQFQLGEDNRLSTLSQKTGEQSWKVNYQSYHADTSPALPNKVKINQNKQRVNLVVSDWNIINE